MCDASHSLRLRDLEAENEGVREAINNLEGWVEHFPNIHKVLASILSFNESNKCDEGWG